MNFGRLMICWFLAIAPTLTRASLNADQTDSQAGIAFFESKVRPVLIEHCYSCHSAEAGESEGELQLDTRTAIRKGGDRGPAVVPGDLKESWLLTAMSHADTDLKMPPKRERLPDAVIADFKKWIEMGAPDPRVGDAATGKKPWKKADRDYWAYQPPKSSTLPLVTDVIWPKANLDYFILAKLEENELSPSPDAQPQVLLRRLHFDLVVPIQALYLLNSPFAQDRANGLATRLIKEEGTDEQRIQRAFLLCFSRQPEQVEMNRSLDFLKNKKHSVDENHCLAERY